MVMERWGWMGGSSIGEADIDVGGMDDVKEASSSSGIRHLGRKVVKYMSSTTTAAVWDEFNRQQREGDFASPSSPPTTSLPYQWGFGRTGTSSAGLLMVLQDIQILIMLAVLLAIVRIWFVHMLVPEYLAPRRLEALTRCKSSHMLSSSSYKFTDLKGWDAATERAGVRRESLSGRCSVDVSSLSRPEGEEKRGWHDRLLVWVSAHWYRCDYLIHLLLH